MSAEPNRDILPSTLAAAMPFDLEEIRSRHNLWKAQLPNTVPKGSALAFVLGERIADTELLLAEVDRLMLLNAELASALMDEVRGDQEREDT